MDHLACLTVTQLVQAIGERQGSVVCLGASILSLGIGLIRAAGNDGRP